MAKRLILDAKLDSSAAVGLRENLEKSQKQDLTIDGSQVEFLGALCFETLLAARHTWDKLGNVLQFENASDAFCRDILQMGQCMENFSAGANSE